MSKFRQAGDKYKVQDKKQAQYQETISAPSISALLLIVNPHCQSTLTFLLELLPADLLDAVDERGCMVAGDIDRVGTFDEAPSLGAGDRRCNDRWDGFGACILAYIFGLPSLFLLIFYIPSLLLLLPYEVDINS